MGSDLLLRRKLTLRAAGPDGAPRQVVFVKRPGESAEHVLMKAVLWALYLPAYPDLAVEVPIGDRYKPDVVQRAPDGRPVFWGEAGKVSEAKLRSLARRFPETHFALAKWGARLGPHEALARAALARAAPSGRPRAAPFELIGVPPDAARLVGDDGTLTVTFADVERVRIA